MRCAIANYVDRVERKGGKRLMSSAKAMRDEE